MEWEDFGRSETKEPNGSWTERHIVWILDKGWMSLNTTKERINKLEYMSMEVTWTDMLRKERLRKQSISTALE